MSKEFRRFELLLPLRFNDGESIPDEAIGATLRELREQFGAVSFESQTICGQWEHGGQVYRDDLVRVFVDAPDTPESREFFVSFKDRVKSRFRQIDIWMTTYRIEVL
jgi:hypothetical protein